MMTKKCVRSDIKNKTYPIEISVIIPLFNEEDSLQILYEKLIGVLDETEKRFEIIFVNDGSSDNSSSVLHEIQENDERVVVFESERNYGKANALSEGFKLSKGSIIFTMDADLQDDPEEIPNFLAKMEEGYDLISGWKFKRYDPVSKTLPSKIFNAVTSMCTGLRLHDFNCGFKSYKKDVVKEIDIYGELHRFIPALAHWQGFKVGEIKVKHHPRKFGKSKYGVERLKRGFFDLLTVIFLTKYIRNPSYLFCSIGFLLTLFGVGIFGYLTFLQISYGSIFGHKPLSYLGLLLILFGVQLVSIGLLAEFIIYHLQKLKLRTISMKNAFFHNNSEDVYLSIIIPVYNEKDSLVPLYKGIIQRLENHEIHYEIIFVDDGSSDGSLTILKELWEKDCRVNVYQLRRNFGKSSAINIGFDKARGSVLMTMDADLQDDPDRIPDFLVMIDKGNDFVIGRRTNVPFPRSITSMAFNKFISIVGGVKIGDINCGFKAFKKEVITDITLYGEMARLFPLLVAKNKYRITELPLPHIKRKFGKSKYGLIRIPKAFIDLITAMFLSEYTRRPLHFFGTSGLIFLIIGLLINSYLAIHKLLTGHFGGHYTLLLTGCMFLILGLQWFSMGLISELLNDFHKLKRRTNQ